MSAENITPGSGALGITEIMEILPHRYPFLLIDRVLELVRMQRIVAIKNVTINEPFFQGHFPTYPIMPGVLMVEAMAQAGGALLLTEVPDRHDKLMVFTGIDQAKFRAAVVPGDQVRIEVEVLKWSRRGATMRGSAYVDGKLVCEAEIKCQLVPRATRKSEPHETPALAGAATE
jgi:3-hydroxyacyl-[acyl-carrier-protein] dehydratase